MRLLLAPVVLSLFSAGALSHDDIAAREKEFHYGYQVGYITAIRDAHEGLLMCTKDIPLLELIQSIRAYKVANTIPTDQPPSAKVIIDALSTKYKCKRK